MRSYEALALFFETCLVLSGCKCKMLIDNDNRFLSAFCSPPSGMRAQVCDHFNSLCIPNVSACFIFLVQCINEFQPPCDVQNVLRTCRVVVKNKKNKQLSSKDERKFNVFINNYTKQIMTYLQGLQVQQVQTTMISIHQQTC